MKSRRLRRQSLESSTFRRSTLTELHWRSTSASRCFWTQPMTRARRRMLQLSCSISTMCFACPTRTAGSTPSLSCQPPAIQPVQAGSCPACSSNLKNGTASRLGLACFKGARRGGRSSRVALHPVPLGIAAWHVQVVQIGGPIRALGTA